MSNFQKLSHNRVKTFPAIFHGSIFVLFSYISPSLCQRAILPHLGDAILEYVDLAFNQEFYLVGLSGIPDFKLTLWNWQRGEKIQSVDTHLGVINQLINSIIPILCDFN